MAENWSTKEQMRKTPKKSSKISPENAKKPKFFKKVKELISCQTQYMIDIIFRVQRSCLIRSISKGAVNWYIEPIKTDIPL